MDITVVITTFPNSEASNEVARKLVGEDLVSCINVVPGVSSHYKWEGQLCCSEELIFIMKVQTSKLEELEVRVRELHPYKTFEFIGIPISYCNDSYLKWLTSGS